MEVILNAATGNGSNGSASGITRLLEEAGLEANLSVARNGTELEALAQIAARSTSNVIVAAGGDGTLNAVAGAIMGTGKCLGVLPLGTLNHFAKDLGIPLKLPEAVKTLKEGKPAMIDTGEVNGGIFLNNSSIGLYPDMVRRRDKQQQVFNRGKWRAFVSATLDVMRRCKFVRVKVLGLQRDTPFVFVGNNPYRLDGFGIGGRDSLKTGELCIWIGRCTRPTGLFVLGIRALFGRLRGARDLEVFNGKEFDLDLRQARVRVSLDGETTILEPPLHYRTRPRSLPVLLPPGVTGTGSG